MIIRYCLALQAKSAAAYNEMRFDEKTGTGFVVLPSQRRLRDYKNYIHPKQGFNHEIINELKNKIKDFSDIEHFMVILFDEMKIQENLVWSKHTGDLIGFVDLGDVNLNYATLQETNAICIPCTSVFTSKCKSTLSNLVWLILQLEMPQPVKYSHCSGRLLQFVKHSVPLKLLLLLVMGHLLIVNFSECTLD